MERNYKFDESVELFIETTDGDNITLFGSPSRVNGNIVGDLIELYEDDELLRVETKGQKLDTCFLFMLPRSDIKYQLNGGFVTFTKGDDILFMEMRSKIKRIVTIIDDGIEEHRLDLCE